MLARTLVLALMAAAAVLPASAAHTTYDRAASMAAGETSLGKGYDGANAAGAVKASVSGVPSGAGLAAPGSPLTSQPHASLDAASVPSPALTIGLEAAGAAVGAVAGGFLGGPIGAAFGAILGFGIAFMVSKLLG